MQRQKTIQANKWWGIGAIVTLPILMGLWWLPDFLLQPDYEGLEKNEKAMLVHQYRGTLIGMVGGLVLYLNFLVANRNAETARRNLELAEDRLKQDTEKITKDAKLAEDRLTSERFTKAVEQLGNDDSIHIRLGGIYSLGRLAEDSDGMHKIVLDVLSAFIREKHPKARSAEPPLRGQQLATDVKAALTIISTRKKDGDIIDLSNTDFRNRSLSGLKLSEVDLSNANLSGFDLIHGSLSGARLRFADLSGDASLHHANLSGANFDNANLSGANLIETNLIDAELCYANLSDADLGKANLNRAKLMSAQFSKAILCVTKLGEANLERACFFMALLNGVDLRKANLDAAVFDHAILLGTNLLGSEWLTKKQFQGDNPPFLCGVALPDNLIEEGIDPNRDCDCLPQVLSERYGYYLEDAQKFVDDARQTTWD